MAEERSHARIARSLLNKLEIGDPPLTWFDIYKKGYDHETHLLPKNGKGSATRDFSADRSRDRWFTTTRLRL